MSESHFRQIRPNPMNTLIHKSDPGPCFEVSKKKQLKLRCDLLVIVASDIVKFAAGTLITLPKTLTPGTDYAVCATAEGLLLADADFSTPAGKKTNEVTKIGGFHFAPGGCAQDREGGNTTPAINPFSFWDLCWRPACPDPRSMALVDGRFWVDIYLCGIDGATRHGATIADGRNHAKMPAMFGGDGSAEYNGLNCFQAAQLACAAGKQLLTREEFQLAAFGVLEKSSADMRHEITQLDAPRTSKWGLMQATGCRYIWGVIDPLQTFNKFKSKEHIGTNLFGGYWGNGGHAGSRCSYWDNAPWDSYYTFGARFRSDHLVLA